MRDYYIRRKGKPGSGSSGIAAKKRSALLSFSDSFAVSQSPLTTNVESSQGLSNGIQLSHNEPDIDTTPGIIMPEILEHHSNDALGDMKEDKLKCAAPQKRKTNKYTFCRAIKAVETDS
ncbi:hypothetical protein TNIN_222241 [Trichonephila inaurata madagascariensis]|uniref:Uncharacterized protein n=1 Tax=Trichonephila inaurata madagascariensis TaxID=2747483 RepID=A0A8X6XHF5_9ARAC|nr:hypothetical protein TNIN_222241 [Trichonephila inaurata madagascariensis]